MKKFQVLKVNLFFILLLIQGCGLDDELDTQSTLCNGTGTITDSNSTYVGQCREGIKEGKGILTFHSGGKYDGEWHEGKKNGQGTFSYVNGTVYIGNWKDGKKKGQGVMSYYWGDKYDGEWYNDIQAWDTSKYKINTYTSGNFATLIIPKKQFNELDKVNSSYIFPDLNKVLSKFVLSKYQDKFNHIVLVRDGNKEEYQYGGYHHLIKNDVKGIGMDLLDNSKEYASKGALKSLLNISKINYFNYAYRHEILHQFSNTFIPTTDSYHYSFSTGGVLGGFSNESLIQLDEDKYQAKYNNLETFRISHNSSIYSLLDLYLMGFASKDEIPIIKVAKCDKEITNKEECPYWIDENKGIFYANYIEDISIDTLIKKHGKRVPSYENSSKNLRGIIVLVSSKKLSVDRLKEFDEKVKNEMNDFLKYTLDRATLRLDDLFSVEK